ncbi:hypothetical protein NQ176_g5042 [Zarea fungicola]|uniref:Uncharacterized protein n=1 Tax=Zarea fungicola TaxID=93591 RepID=A0ACC1NB45_9HYPO|nr:hypothetical protein NQ176_g5042 [Lecanicillium fungicola]
MVAAFNAVVNKRQPSPWSILVFATSKADIISITQKLHKYTTSLDVLPLVTSQVLRAQRTSGDIARAGCAAVAHTALRIVFKEARAALRLQVSSAASKQRRAAAAAGTYLSKRHGLA